MKNWILYGILNSILGILIGIFISTNSIGEGYYSFAIAAPISIFIVGGIFWNIIIKEKLDNKRIAIVGLLTGIVSHYFTFILLAIEANICYWLFGKCTDSLGNAPISISEMFKAAFTFSMISLLIFGWLTTTYSILSGMLIKYLVTKKTSHNINCAK